MNTLLTDKTLYTTYYTNKSRYSVVHSSHDKKKEFLFHRNAQLLHQSTKLGNSQVSPHEQKIEEIVGKSMKRQKESKTESKKESKKEAE